MNSFEQELRKLFDDNTLLENKKFIGRTCYGKLGENTRAKIEFIRNGVANRYEGIKTTLINKNDGVIDSHILLFSDLLGKKKVSNPNFSEGVYPYIWQYGDTAEWYVYKPTKLDYKKIATAVTDYLDMFQDFSHELNKGMQESDMQSDIQQMMC